VKTSFTQKEKKYTQKLSLVGYSDKKRSAIRITRESYVALMRASARKKRLNRDKTLLFIRLTR